MDAIAISITDGSQTAPIAAFSADVTNICAGQVISFQDESLNNPTAWSWVFEGGQPATSTDQYPSVIYTETGTYTIQLIVNNDAGSNTTILIDYIIVEDGSMEEVCDFSTASRIAWDRTFGTNRGDGLGDIVYRLLGDKNK